MGPFLLKPLDEHNLRLLNNVQPADWKNPSPQPVYDLVVIGAGTAGLVAAAGAAGLGARVALVERLLFGGDCLNFGCVPSKTLLAWAKKATFHSDSGEYFRRSMEAVRKIRADISENDSVRRFRSLGVDVFLGEASFVNGREIEVAGSTLRFQKAVIATGGRARVPEIAGLRETGYFTNESIFSLVELPRRLAVIGGGPIGCELAQAFSRLGSSVTLFHDSDRLLPREEPQAANLVTEALREDGVSIKLSSELSEVRQSADGKEILYREASGDANLLVDEILVAAGRQANVEGLHLERAGVESEPGRGVLVNDHLRTSNRRIYASGDVCMDWKFTHAADVASRIVLQNALFFGRKRLSSVTMSWCTYTDPELAHVGFSDEEAAKQGIEVQPFERSFAEVDRAKAEGDTKGYVRILTELGTGRIVGATCVGRGAGDLVSEISVAMSAGLPLGALANVVHPYPTRAEILRQLGDSYNRTRLTPFLKKILAFRFRLPF